MRKPKCLKALLIDMDGTLADSILLLYDAYAAFMHDFGLIPTKEEFTSLIGPSLVDIVTRLKERHLIQGERNALIAIYHRHVEDRYAHPVKLFPDSRECLLFAKQHGIRCILVTSATHNLAHSFVRAQQLDGVIDLLITGELVDKGKPDPALYLMALEKAGITASEAIAIEDSDAGVTAATKAGIATFHLFGKGELAVESWDAIHQKLRSWYE